MSNETESADDYDVIEVPDELMEQMGGLPEPKPELSDDDKKTGEEEDGKKQEQEDDDNPGGNNDQSFVDDKTPGEEEGIDEGAKKEDNKPPENYKRKKAKTQKRIRELTTKNYQANQRAEDAESALEAEREESRKLRAQIDGTGNEEDNLISDLDEAIEFAEDDGKTGVAKILRERRDRLKDGGGDDEPVARTDDQQPAAQEQTQEINSDAQKWLDDNQWVNATDGLGRLMYPQLRQEAYNRQQELLKTMPMGEDLYDQISSDMEETLDAYNLSPVSARTTVPDDAGDEDNPRAGLQPHRGGGAEDGGKPKGDHLSNKEVAYMKARFKNIGWEDTPEHRKAWISNIRR